MNKKITKYLITFLFGCLITCILFIPSFNVDGICTKFNGYAKTSVIFLKAGRVLTYICYLIFDKINLSTEMLSIISIILSNLFLSISIIDFYRLIKIENKKTNIILYLLSFFLIYNPFTIELFLFDEAFIMCLGIMFGIKAVSILNTDKRYKYFISLLFASLCVMCYQGIICIFLPICFLNIVLNLKTKTFKLQIKEILIEFIKVIIIYGLALIINFIIVKFINSFIVESAKLGELNIFKNIIHAFNFFTTTNKYLGGYISNKIYYIFIFGFIISLLCCLMYRKKKGDIYYTLYIMFAIFLAIATPFIINLAMKTSENYTAARMYISIGFTIPFLAIFCIKKFNILNIKYLNNIFICLICIYSIYLSYNYFYITKGGLDSYNMDIKYMEKIENKIKEYEKKTGNTVQNIYWTYDINSNFCNDVGFCNSYSYRFFATDWSGAASIGVLDTNVKTNYIPMNEKQKNKYFKDKINKDYNKYSDEQLVFDKNNLYLLIY